MNFLYRIVFIIIVFSHKTVKIFQLETFASMYLYRYQKTQTALPGFTSEAVQLGEVKKNPLN